MAERSSDTPDNVLTVILLQQLLAAVAFEQAGPADTGYAGSDGPVPQKWVNGNGTSVRKHITADLNRSFLSAHFPMPLHIRGVWKLMFTFMASVVSCTCLELHVLFRRFVTSGSSRKMC